MIAYGLFLGLIALIVVLAILRRGEGIADDEPGETDDGHGEDA